MSEIALPAIIIPEGSHTFGPFNVAKNLTSFLLQLDATQHLNPGVRVTVQVSISTDNGQTWQNVASASLPGGVIVGDGGVIETSLHLSAGLPDPTEVRRARAEVTVSGGSFVTAGGSLALD